MIKDLTAVTVVLIIVVGVLLYVWTDRRRKTRRHDLVDARSRKDLAERALDSIKRELVLQDQAGRTDLYPIHMILDQYAMTVQDRDKSTTA
jgi:hypothetical protein